MSSTHLSIRISRDMLERLDRAARLAGRSRSEVAKTLIEEGLRMEAHPGIVFRPGPTGRRAALRDGMEIWQIGRLFRDLPFAGDALVDEVASLTELSPDQVRAALRYYSEYKDEIDEWIRRVDEEAEQAHATSQRERAILRR